MRIIIEAAGTPFAYLEVDPSTLRTVDECGDPVVLFPAPGERDMTTLRQLIEEAAREDLPRPAPGYRAQLLAAANRRAEEAGQ